MSIRSKHRPEHRLGWITEIRQKLRDIMQPVPVDVRHRAPGDEQPEPAEQKPVDEPVEHTGADENWSPRAALAAVGAGVLDHHPEPPVMGSEADEAFWHERFAEIERGFRAELDRYETAFHAEHYADVGDIFEDSYIAAVAQTAWIEHDTREFMTGEIVLPALRAVPSTRPPGKAARRRYHDERRLIGATA